MFLKHEDHSEYADLSVFARDPLEWKVGTLREFEFPLDVSAIAFNPVSSILAVGTHGGTIYLRGGPGVESRLLLPEANSVQFLQFGLLTDRLVCLDSRHQLHIWDLSPLGSPKHMAMVRWDPVMFMILSPSHSHIFLAKNNGEIRTYDLACMRKSPYIIPNLWRSYEEQLRKAGATSQNVGHQPVELLPHPRNLNLLFVAYEGGVVLLDLKERGAVRVFESVFLFGNLTGDEAYSQNTILPPRRSSVTSISIHPSGHFFAVGHADGIIAFWAVEDAAQPIFVRTLDSTGAKNVNGELFESHTGAAATHGSPSSREPIFKLSWSGFPNSKDPRGGDTILTVLGGFKGDNVFGLSVFLFPPFNPGDPPVAPPPAAQGTLDPFMITAMQHSLHEGRRFTYSTSGPVQDFCLIPRDNPHFNYTYDPYAILILVDAGQNMRTLDSREFPPPFFTAPGEQPAELATTQSQEDMGDLDATLMSLSITAQPQLVGLPFELSGSNFFASNQRMFILDKEIYSELREGPEAPIKRPKLRLLGGVADVESSHTAKTSKYQPHRILVVPNKNLTVSFFDMSNQLIQEDSPLRHDFLEAIDVLEIDLQPVLDTLDSEPLANEVYHPTRDIHSVHFAIETLECVVALSSGEILVYRPKSAGAIRSADEAQVKQLRKLSHITTEPWRTLSPYFALLASKGRSVQTISISEVGFLAVSLGDGSLFVIDLRGPTILHGPTELRDGVSGSTGLPSSVHGHTSVDGFASLTWTISGLNKDPKARIRLVAVRTSGSTEVYTIVQSSSGYTLEPPISLGKTSPHPLPDGIFVITSKTGAFCKADRGRFAAVHQTKDQASEPVFLVTASAKGVRSFANIDGQRLGKADWNSKYGGVIGVQVVDRMGSKVFVAYTDKGNLHVYSLPHLEHIHTILAPPSPFSSISIDESGDFMGFHMHPSFGLVHQATYGTLFNFRRACELPVVDLVANKGTAPPQPQPVPLGPQSFLGSWLKFNQTMSGQQLDELLAGPERPPPVERTRDQMRDNAGLSPGNAAQGTFMASASAMRSNVYDRLSSALNERGQMLGELGENFKALEQGSKDMVTQAKRLAAENTAKSWFRF